MAYGSVCETQYQLTIAQRLEYLMPQIAESVTSQCAETARVLNGLLRAYRQPGRCVQ